MKIVEKIKATSKSSTKQIKVGSKKFVRAKVEEEVKSVKESQSTAKHRQLLVVQLDLCKNSPKQEENKSIVVLDAKIVRKPKVRKRKYKKIFQKKIFQTKMSPTGFVAMIEKFNVAQKQAILDMSF